jgi:hypothetical protein
LIRGKAGASRNPDLQQPHQPLLDRDRLMVDPWCSCNSNANASGGQGRENK